MPRGKKQQPNGQAVGAAKPTQKEMVQAALKAGEVNPKSNVDLSGWIKEKYSVSLNPQQIAQVKTSLPKKKGKSKAKQAKPSDYSDGSGDFPKPTPKGHDPNISQRFAEVLADLHTVRQIADRIGAAGVRKLLEILGK